MTESGGLRHRLSVVSAYQARDQKPYATAGPMSAS
jgi:hypothetical protein